jgi:hypothetical protein
MPPTPATTRNLLGVRRYGCPEDGAGDTLIPALVRDDVGGV